LWAILTRLDEINIHFLVGNFTPNRYKVSNRNINRLSKEKSAEVFTPISGILLVTIVMLNTIQKI